jgi:rhodanese-related sulfurtransferase
VSWSLTTPAVDTLVAGGELVVANVHDLPGGLSSWDAAGLPVEREVLP